VDQIARKRFDGDDEGDRLAEAGSSCERGESVASGPKWKRRQGRVEVPGGAM